MAKSVGSQRISKSTDLYKCLTPTLKNCLSLHLLCISSFLSIAEALLLTYSLTQSEYLLYR